MSSADARFTLEDLNARAADALADSGDNAEIGLRTIRYYVSLGLLDRPAAMLGRKAFYGERHLLQLVAIRRLQGEGVSLHEVQSRMADIPSTSLKKLAKVPEHLLIAKRAADTEALWAPSAVEARAQAEPPSLKTVPLDSAVTVCIATQQMMSAGDIDAIHEAARELIRVLQARGLIAAPGATQVQLDAPTAAEAPDAPTPQAKLRRRYNDVAKAATRKAASTAAATRAR